MAAYFREQLGVKSGVRFGNTQYELVAVPNIVSAKVKAVDRSYLANTVCRESLSAISHCFGAGLDHLPSAVQLSLVSERILVGDRDMNTSYVCTDSIKAIDKIMLYSGTVAVSTDSFYVKSGYTPGIILAVHEIIGITSAAYNRSVIRDKLSDSFGASDEVEVFSRVDVLDQIKISDSLFIVPRGGFARDSIGIKSNTFSYSTLLETVRELLKAEDKSTALFSATAKDIFFSRSNVTAKTVSKATARSFVGVYGYALVDLSNYTLCKDSFAVKDSYAPVVKITRTLREFLSVTTRALSERNDSLSAWTTDLRSWGMSRYLNLPVREFVGVQYGFGPGGVYTGRGTVSTGRVETGYLLDRNAEAQAPVRQEKHLNYVYVYGASLGSLALYVRAEDAAGHQRVTTYRANNFSQTPSAVRIQTGRGIRSTWLSFIINGEQFRIEYIDAQYTPTRRRV